MYQGGFWKKRGGLYYTCITEDFFQMTWNVQNQHKRAHSIGKFLESFCEWHQEFCDCQRAIRCADVPTHFAASNNLPVDKFLLPSLCRTLHLGAQEMHIAVGVNERNAKWLFLWPTWYQKIPIKRPTLKKTRVISGIVIWLTLLTTFRQTPSPISPGGALLQVRI